MAGRQTSPEGNSTNLGQGSNTSSGLQYSDIQSRVTLLEAHLEYVRRDLEEIRAGNRSLLEGLDDVARALTASNAEIERTIYDVTQRFSDSQALITQSLFELPKKRDLHIYAITALAIGLAVMGIVIGGIIGGLDWIKSY